MNKLESSQEYVRQKLEASAACALRLRAKIESGEYATEDVPCFCGSTNEQEVDTEDRYGIPMRTVVCLDCALVRVNPRLTEEAFDEFYNNEYRELNFPRFLTCDISSEEEEQAALYERQLARGQNLIKMVAQQAIPAPKVVVDFGCHLGGMLVPFRDKYNSELHGIEIDEDAAWTVAQQGINVVASIDELIAQGVKADLVIMQDVIEHFTDLNIIRKVSEILAKDGYLYVYTPGMFRANFQGNKQLAHTYYFCANTLNWVMVELGFYPTYIDEDCTSFWQHSPNLRKVTRPVEWIEYQVDEIHGKEYRRMPPFNGVCKFTKEELYKNMTTNFAMKHPDLHVLSETMSGGVAIIGGGPSVNHQVAEIQSLQRHGVKIMAILRMYPWCVENGITPDYVVSLDCMDDQKHGFSKKVPGVTYLFASVTNPEFFDIVKGEKIYIFDSRDDRKIQDLRRKAGYTTCSVVNGGGSVVICCMSLAFNLGFRDLHCFGMDFMFPNRERTHAEGIAGTSVPQRVIPVRIGEEDVLTSPSFLEFANQALDLISVAHAEGALDSIKFYGENLVDKLWDGKFVEEDDGQSVQLPA